MDNNEFLKRLEELAELKKVKVAKNGRLREAEGACDIYRNGQTFIIDKDNNHTWAYEVKRLKPQIKACEDCGKECKDRRVNKSLYAFPKQHWRSHCSGCNRVWNPETLKFDLMPTHAQYHFITWFKKQR